MDGAPAPTARSRFLRLQNLALIRHLFFRARDRNLPDELGRGNGEATRQRGSKAKRAGFSVVSPYFCASASAPGRSFRHVNINNMPGARRFWCFANQWNTVLHDSWRKVKTGHQRLARERTRWRGRGIPAIGWDYGTDRICSFGWRTHRRSLRASSWPRRRRRHFWATFGTYWLAPGSGR